MRIKKNIFMFINKKLKKNNSKLKIGGAKTHRLNSSITHATGTGGGGPAS